jgi:hypothetical protein
MLDIHPCRDADELRAYIDRHWRKDHVLARDERMFRFQYMTPWVDRATFPDGISVLCAHLDGELVGFLGSIVTPYPRPQSYWLALWHVLPSMKGGGQGGKLLQAMQDVAIGPTGRKGGWIGTFGAGPDALPVYLKRGFQARAVRRWVFQPERAGAGDAAAYAPFALHGAEAPANDEWLDFRFRRHPIFEYEWRESGIYRTDSNEWGVVTHCLRLHPDAAHRLESDVAEVYERDRALAAREGRNYLMDAWSFDAPGAAWTLAPDDLPSVFHPPAARGNVIYAVGKSFLPTYVQKGDCDQDRPN